MTAFILAHRVTLLTIGGAIVVTVAVLAAALSRWDGHRAEDRREAAHARQSRLAAAWWWCRDRAAWWWWKGWYTPTRVSALWRRLWQKDWDDWEVHHETVLPIRGDAEEREGGCAPAPRDESLCREPRPAAGADMTGLLSPRPQEGARPLSAPPAGHTRAGGAPPSPALPPAVTQAFAAAWATLDGFSQTEFNTDWFTALKAGAA